MADVVTELSVHQPRTSFDRDIMSLYAEQEDATSIPTQDSTAEDFSFAVHAEFVYIRGLGAIFVGVAGTVINVLVFLLIWRHGAGTAQNRLMMNLTLNNIFYSCAILPCMSFSHFAGHLVPRGAPCVIFAFALHVIQGMAVLSLLLISLNRFFVILCSKDPRFTFGGWQRTLAILLASWVLSSLLLSPPTAGLWAQYGFDWRFGVCTLIRSDAKSAKMFNLAISLLAFVLPLSGMICCYARILWAVRKQGRSISHGSLVKGHRRREIAITWLSLRLVLAFILLNLPFTLTIVIPVLEQTPGFQATATLTMWCHALVNPVLYISGDSRLRNAFLEKIGKTPKDAAELSVVSSKT
ncbi:hypothetical protein CAPTEDRAFT_207770 [Capitella teleta]|uniref:G-protein coupled receptors family 1 profile domain-containing protein n=1 Tax=Capitella teleta TaxID=283909 RepID=R7TW21_CAPTE|nr:hypothetical protein CAPTEDRAFT_207770 [Capitella teleta]|eukprot:ELT98108.1 hypothetical protein CAPTEDRAFT_207770 [Capitella teleta]